MAEVAAAAAAPRAKAAAPKAPAAKTAARKPAASKKAAAKTAPAAEPAAPAARKRAARSATDTPAPAAPVASEPAAAPSRRGRARPAPPDDAARVEAVVAPADAPQPPPSRRGTAKRRPPVAAPVAAEAVEPAAVEAAASGAPEADAAAPTRSRRSRGGRNRPTHDTAADAAPAPDAAPAASPPPAAALATIDPPADGALFGRYAVLVPGEEPAEVTLRAAALGSDWCSCLDFVLSEDGRCPHVDALRTQWLADPGREQALAQGPQRVFSRVELQQAARRRLLWLPGRECPAALHTLALQLLDGPADALDDQALPRLLRAAREAGHELQVDESVWAHLAAARDARWRVQRLQTLLPDGPFSAALADLRPEPLLPVQLEAALFAVCAGRCILADDAVLQPLEQALAAAAVWQRHFGVERVLLLAPRDQLDRCRRRLPAAAEGWSLTALEQLVQDQALHRSLAPQLVILLEPDEGGLWVDPDRAAALLRLPSAHAIVLPAAGWLERPAELPLRLAYVDAQRLGAYDALLQVHGERDESGQLCGLHGLGTLRATLEPVLLMRARAEVLSQLPERLDRVRHVEMPPAEAARHAEAAAALALRVGRWQRQGWLPDAEQRQLLAQVQALRAWCAGVDAPGMAAAKAAAVQALLDDADAPAAKLVVFCQWPAALDALQAALAVAGVGCARWSAREPEPARRAAAQRLAADPACRVLLVADAGSSGLELQCPEAQVLHLDRPWNPKLLTRRFGRVHRRGKAHLVPVTQLRAAGSFEDALAALMADRREPVPDLLDANAAEGFLQGDELQQLQADLIALLGLAEA